LKAARTISSPGSREEGTGTEEKEDIQDSPVGGEKRLKIRRSRAVGGGDGVSESMGEIDLWEKKGKQRKRRTAPKLVETQEGNKAGASLWEGT